jgi:hypothetical protein
MGVGAIDDEHNDAANSDRVMRADDFLYAAKSAGATACALEWRVASVLPTVPTISPGLAGYAVAVLRVLT